MKPKATSWMWRYEGEVQGADLDIEDKTVKWFDGLGCACGDNANEQTFEDFLKRGAIWGDPPQDVEAEMRAAVEWHLQAENAD